MNTIENQNWQGQAGEAQLGTALDMKLVKAIKVHTLSFGEGADPGKISGKMFETCCSCAS